MKKKHITRLSCLIFTALLLIGCKEIEPIQITSAKKIVYSKNVAAVVPIPEPMIRALTQTQIELVQGWLKANRTDWSKHNPMATLLPQWCIELTSASGKAHDLCRYQDKAVLRGLGVEMERPLTEKDKVLFMQLVEDTK